MNESDVIDIARESIIVMLEVGGPILILGLIVGILVSLIQTVTQIQEATLAFVPKLLVIGIALVVMLPFMMQSLGGFTQRLFERIASMGTAA